MTIEPEAYSEKPYPCPHKLGITCHKAICANCDYKPKGGNMTIEIRYYGVCPNDHKTGVIVTDLLDRNPETNPFFCPICELPMKMKLPPYVTDVVHEDLL